MGDCEEEGGKARGDCGEAGISMAQRGDRGGCSEPVNDDHGNSSG